MPITVAWDEHIPSAMRLTFRSPWTWEEYYDIDPQCDALLQHTPRDRVNLIIDFTNGNKLPVDASIHFQRSFGTLNPVIHTLMIVGADDMLRLTLKTVKHRLPGTIQKVKFVDTIAAARQQIAQRPDDDTPPTGFLPDSR